MIDPDVFARQQMELASEFAKFVIENPDFDDSLPEDAYVYFQVDGEAAFNQYSRQLAERRERDDGMIPVCVRLKGLAPPQGSRLVDPQIVPGSGVV